jgi:hypothetical protein
MNDRKYEMLQALQKIELMSLNLSFEAMIGVGALLLAAGLCVWLGGLRWIFISGALSGAFAGAVCASFTPAEFQAKAFCIPAVAVACFVMVFRKRSLVFVGALVVVFSGLFISALPAISESSGWQTPETPEKTEGVERLSAGDSFTVLYEQLFFLCGTVGSHIKQLSVGPFIIVSVAGFAMLLVGLFFTRIVACISASMLGTLFVFVGMTVLLLQKGSMPFSVIYEKSIFYQTLIICMIAFGSVCGLFLCPIGRAKPVIDKKDKGEKK